VRVESAGKRIARTATGVADVVRAVANRAKIAAKDRREAAERQALLFAAPSVSERQEDLRRFYDRYEQLVEVLCDAAQYGPAPKLERSYEELRKWMEGRYGGLRPYVVAYLRYSAEDAELSLAVGGRGADAFEALVAAPTLAEFLEHDDGGMISRITRTREALNLYGEHLRQLAARQG
jgi:hypothetical protein